MPPHPSDQSEVVRHLEAIYTQLAKQNSFSHMFLVGIIYGVGFFVGSAVLATIAFGILAPWFAEVPWIRDAFLTGISWLR
jgi:hypothetical protein